MSNCLALHGQDKREKLEYKCQSFNRMGITHYCCLCILFMYLCLLHKYFCVSKWELKRSRCKTINVSKCHIILISIQLCGTWISDEHSVHVVIMTISPPFSWIDYSKYGYVLCQYIPTPGIKLWQCLSHCIPRHLTYAVCELRSTLCTKSQLYIRMGPYIKQISLEHLWYIRQMPLEHLSYIKETPWNTSGRT